MADPNSTDDLVKVAGGAGGSGLLAAVWAFFSRASMAQRLDALAQQMADLNGKVTVLVAASERRDNDADRLDAERRLAALEAKVDSMQRTLDQVVHS